MRVLHCFMGAIMLISGIDVIFTTSAGSLYACPRCRRAQPKGPRKRPHPGFPKKDIKGNLSTSNIKESVNEQK